MQITQCTEHSKQEELEVQRTHQYQNNTKVTVKMDSSYQKILPSPIPNDFPFLRTQFL